MALPHEAEAITDIATTYRGELDAMTALHDAVVGMMSQTSWSIGKGRGLDRLTGETMVGLLTKACKTFRSIQILLERGLIDDANVLVRVLMENTVAVVFILQKHSRRRARIYHAHAMAQDVKMLNHWKTTPSLKRKATKEIIKLANDGLASWAKALPAGTDFQRHWSGKASFLEAVKAVHAEAIYATVFRFASAKTHVTDFAGHVEIERASGDLIYQIDPCSKGFEAPSHASRALLWAAASRIDQRLGLGFVTALAPH
jgi:hypothetical protein